MKSTEILDDPWWYSLPVATHPVSTDLCHTCGIARFIHKRRGCGATRPKYVIAGLPAEYRYDAIPDGTWGGYGDKPAGDFRDSNHRRQWWNVPPKYSI